MSIMLMKILSHSGHFHSEGWSMAAGLVLLIWVALSVLHNWWSCLDGWFSAHPSSKPPITLCLQNFKRFYRQIQEYWQICPNLTRVKRSFETVNDNTSIAAVKIARQQERCDLFNREGLTDEGRTSIRQLTGSISLSKSAPEGKKRMSHVSGTWVGTICFSMWTWTEKKHIQSVLGYQH